MTKTPIADSMLKTNPLQLAISMNTDLFEELFGIVDGFYDLGKFYILVHEFDGTLGEFIEQNECLPL
jgi:hypothetical protein